MDVLMSRGSIPNGSEAPRFIDLFPALVDPAKLILRDGFEKRTAGILRGQQFDLSDAGQLWQGIGGNPNQVLAAPEADGGYVHFGIAAYLYGELGQADGKVCSLIRWGVATSYAGVLFRFTDNSNWWRASLSSVSGGTVRLEKMVGGAVTHVGSVPATLVVGSVYQLGVHFAGDYIRVILGASETHELTDITHATATKVGMSAGNTAHRYLDFAAGEA